MNKEEFAKRLMSTFLDEVEERVAAFNQGILALEKATSQEESRGVLRDLFRAAHSLKGAAGAVNVRVVGNACHHLETILSQLQSNDRKVDAELSALFFAAADAIEEAAMRLREDQDLADSPLAALIPRLSAAATPAQQKPAQAAELPPQTVESSSRAPDAPFSPAAAADMPKSAASRLPVPEHHSEPITSAFVRVPAEKLDAFLAQSGELSIARRRIAQRVGNLTDIRKMIAREQADWKAAEKILRSKTQPVADDVRANASGKRSEELATARRASALLSRTRDRLRMLTLNLDELTSTLSADVHLLDRAAAGMDDEVRRIRMLPFREVCHGLDRIVRDLGVTSKKDVELTVGGGDVELDRSILEGLKDPLRHLVRNAMDHGIEPVEHRRSVGKPARGRIAISALIRGDRVEVVVADDGGGIDLNRLRESVQRRGGQVPEEERDLLRVLFEPGISTAPMITDISGRGVGLDVVKTSIESMQGTVELSHEPRLGTRFTLTTPLTLTTLRALLVNAGGQTFAFAGINVDKLLRVTADQFRSVEGRDMLVLGGAPTLVVSLAAVLGVRRLEPLKPPAHWSILVATAGEQKMGFVIDEFVAEQAIVIKGLGPRGRGVRLISGATILPSGSIALVLNVPELMRQASGRPSGRTTEVASTSANRQKPRILVVDDSVTTRALEKSILEAAGYNVASAPDGAAAWRMLQEEPADVVVSDVEMPTMDGFALTEAIRSSPRLRELPVVLVTSRESESDKKRGMDAGADAYLVKSAFDQGSLLETIAQLV